MSRIDKHKLIQDAQKFLAKGQLDRALKKYEQILLTHPNNASVRLKVGEVYERLRETKRAITEYRCVASAFASEGFYLKSIAVLTRVVALDPEMVEVHLELAELNQRLGRLAEAVRRYQLAANIDERRGEKRQSIDILKKIADLNPHNRERKLQIAELYYKEGYPSLGLEQFYHATGDLDPASDELLALAQRMLKACPDDPRLMLRLGELHLQRGEIKNAEGFFDAAARLVRDGRTVELLAEAKLQAQMIQEAHALFTEASRLFAAERNHAKARELSARAMECSVSVLDEAQGEAAVLIETEEDMEDQRDEDRAPCLASNLSARRDAPISRIDLRNDFNWPLYDFEVVIDVDDKMPDDEKRAAAKEKSGSAPPPSAQEGPNGHALVVSPGAASTPASPRYSVDQVLPQDPRGIVMTASAAPFYHPETGLPIRALFLDRVERSLTRAKRASDYSFAVLVLDLDQFKTVNDSLGHRIGDELLVAVARRLEECLREGDTAAYLGGDEFSILLEDIRDGKEALRVAERIKEQLALPFPLKDHDVLTTASIGISISTPQYQRPEEFLRDANTAMYRAKAFGKARCELFDQEMHGRAMALLQLETDLRRAVERGEFQVVYQPIVSLAGGRITGFEALVRWRHPFGGMVSPKDFIPIAEAIALIIPIDRWMLREACRQLQAWQEQCPQEGSLTINVNLSGKHFAQPDLIAFIEETLRETGLDPSTLRLEISESVVVENTDSENAMLAQLKALQVELHLDNFGRGRSSLASLHQHPFTALKIDRAFVSDLDSRPEHVEIIRTMLSLARAIGMSVIAQGVETADQLARLRELGCEYAQGYLFSKPVGPEEASALLAQDPTW
ncbi:MAG: hypothetical protein A2Y95_03560 [Deltaproteobacteria bacterium RBG_13_65_10]|nr:MAG: hypothetical protein A2Y95_03560 [Deltaproteobacteria bacterium RBG_13_65_10]